MSKTVLKIAIIILIIAAGYFVWSKNVPPAISTEYKNSDYGFTVTLPLDWKGYTVIMDKWTGNTINNTGGEVTYINGPKILIRNPKWTKEVPYQDIPVMVFTLDQWNEVQQEKISVSAAPIPPSELGRNAKYVFALPARYNYAFPAGFEEVDQIIQSKPLQTF